MPTERFGLIKCLGKETNRCRCVIKIGENSRVYHLKNKSLIRKSLVGTSGKVRIVVELSSIY